MNWKFIFAPLPMLAIMAYAFFTFPRLGDFYFHAGYTGGEAYPNGISFFLGFLTPFMPQGYALMVLTMLVAVVLPYILIFHITKNAMASWVYVYGSNIAGSLYFLWVTPQAIIMLFMLISIIYPPFMLIFGIIGGQFHNAWLLAWLVTAAYLIYERTSLKKKILERFAWLQ